ncbi:MAG: MerR family DNA-binding transcriptional regulator [Clostridiales bacterium]|nr:MerR family DNA-binding transcriptional regulator [Clostridiales bacterium]
MYKIGEVSRYCSIPVKTLRYWADIGLLIPDEVDRFTG